MGSRGNTFTGGLDILAGTVSIDSDRALGAPASVVTLNGGALRLHGSVDFVPERQILVERPDTVIDTQAYTGTLPLGIQGAGGLRKSGPGTLILNGDNGYAGATSVLQGALIVGDSASNAAATISGGGSVTVESGAMLGGYGSVAGDVVNDGTLAVADAIAGAVAAAPALAAAAPPNGGFVVAGTLTNNRLIALSGAAPGNTLTVGSYVGGNGSGISMSTYLGNENSPTDRLVLNGGSATGRSVLNVVGTGGGGAVTGGNGIRLVQANGGATTAASAFSLGAPLVAGPYEYALYRGGQGDTQSWFLRSTVDCANPAVPSSLCPDPDPDPDPAAPPAPVSEVPNYRQEVSLYSTIGPSALVYGRAMMDSLQERMGDYQPEGRSAHGRAWGRALGVFGKNEGSSDGIYGDSAKYSYDITGMQFGQDLYTRQSATGHRDVVGAMGGVGYVKTDTDHYTGQSAGTNRLNIYSLGAYWTHYAPANWYVDSSLMASYYHVRAKSSRSISELKTDGKGLAINVESGYAFDLGDNWRLVPNIQATYQWIDMDAASDDGGQVKFSNIQSLAGRGGVRISKSLRKSGSDSDDMTLWARLGIGHEFKGEPRTAFSAEGGKYIAFPGELDGTWGEIKIGITGRVSSAVSLYASSGYQQTFDGKGHAWDGKLGVRINW
ncbi:hypothetical protein CUR95_14010 [Bordetella bronchiseptica]|nr:hypothetical protein [Bordetella bronchiseptica]